MGIDSEYWFNYYNSDEVVNTNNLQKNVGRTKNGLPINDSEWETVIKYISNKIELSNSDYLLEICCGNGMVIGNLSDKCDRAKGIDYSEKLLNQLNQTYPEIDTELSDVLSSDLGTNVYDKVLLYFAAQHFDERSLVLLISKVVESMTSEGIFFIGDIPDEDRKWDYISSKEHKFDYFSRVVEGTPKIGNWYRKSWFKSLESYLTNTSINIVEQPKSMINSHYRFDVIIKKNK